MNSSDQLEQRIKHALKKLSRVRKLFLLIEIWLRVRVYKFFRTRPRSQMHWLGNKRQRRPERLFIVLVFLEAAFILEPYEFALWSMICGSIVSMLVTVKSIAMLLQREET